MMTKEYCMPPGDDVGGPDLPESTVSYEGGSGSGNSPSRTDLKRGYSLVGSEAMPMGLTGERLNILFPEPGFGGFCGRPNGWER
jgi:hypothetical protein